MPAVITVLVPVLDRPQRALPLADSLAQSARFVPVDLMFLVTPGDQDQIEACHEAKHKHGFVRVKRVPWPVGPGDYPRKINEGARASRSEFMLLGGDDLDFHPGWAEHVLAAYQETGACVIGTNDLGNVHTDERGNHSTHPFVHRDYLDCGTIDDPDGRILLHEGYRHNFCDTEFVATAKARGAYVHCPEARIEHQHPFWGKARSDATYVRGQAGFGEDKLLYEKRRQLWERP